MEQHCSSLGFLQQAPLRVAIGPWAWLTVLVLAAGFGPVHAQFGTRALLIINQEPRMMDGLHEAAEELTITEESPGRLQVGIARAHSRLGIVQADAFAHAEHSSVDATARAKFTDTLIIQAPVPPLTGGWFIARIRVDGTLQAAGFNVLDGPTPGFGSASAATVFSADTRFDTFQRVFSGFRDSSGALEGNESGTLVRRVEFIFGEPIEIECEVIAEARIQGNVPGASGVARAAYGSSAYWTGLTEVFTEDDEPVVEFSVTSASGTDYRADFRPVRSLRLQAPQRSGDTLRISFETQPDHAYRLQGTTDLANPDWQDIVVVTGNGEMQTLEVPVQSEPPQRFFRLAQP
jgi:hypothetical protein